MHSFPKGDLKVQLKEKTKTSYTSAKMSFSKINRAKEQKNKIKLKFLTSFIE
jgi:hypothetical protein